ncbi:MAG: hypothetical protein IPM60_14430 [Rhodospirillales bacterium]|nr:hypothetical protein [Rhodospirillales bacterium]
MKYAVVFGGEVRRFYHAARALEAHEIKHHQGKPVLRPVRVDDVEPGYDPGIFERHGPEFTVGADEVVERYRLRFRVDARDGMAARVDARAEAERARVVAVLAGETIELQETLREAEAVKALPPDAIIDPADYPFLEADVGVTVNPATDAPVQTIREAAQFMLTRRDAWRRRVARLRKRRLAALRQVRDAATDLEAWNALKAADWS